jgi:hypothetical protein
MGLISEGVDLLKLANRAQNADLYKQLGEWIDKVTELHKQNEELTVERNQLREQVRFKGMLERINGHTFVEGDDEEICSRCAEVDLRPVHLARLHSKHPPFVKATCPACKLEMDHNVPFNRARASKERLSPTAF